MAGEELMAAAVRLSAEMEALAALAALVRVETEGIEVDERIRSVLWEVAREVLGPAADVRGPAGASVVGMTRAFLRQAAELVDAPERRGSWAHVDPALLQGLGRLSSAIAGAIKIAERTLDGLGAALATDGAALLDVGTGTGWLAIALARTYPTAHVVGIDVFEPALALARVNVETEQLTNRVELRLQDVGALDDRDAFDAIWFALPFIPIEIVPAAIGRAVAATRRGGWVILGTFAGTGERLSELLVDLRTLRSGGHPWRAGEAIEALRSAGLDHAQEVPRTWPAPVRLFAGRRR